MPARIPAFRRPGSFPRYLRVAARRGRKRAGSGNRYEIGVALVWFGPGIVFGTWQDLTAAPSSTPLLNWPAATLLLLSGTALLGGVCSALGPVTASREWRAWLLSTPLDRGVLLRRRAWGVLAMLVVPGMVLGAAVAGMGGYRGPDALACVLVGVGAVITVGGSTMRRQRRAGATAAGRGWLVGAAAAAGAAVAAEFLVVGPIGTTVLWAAAAVSGIGALSAGVAGLAGVGSIPLFSLAAGSGSTSSVALAFQDQSLEPLAAILAVPPGRRRSEDAVRPLAGAGRRAVLAVHLRQLRRNRSAQIRWVVLAGIPYAVWVLVAGARWASSALAAVTFVSAVAAISGLCGTARVFASTPTLADRYGLAVADTRRATMVLPRISALLWGVLTAPALVMHAPAVVALVVTPAALAIVEYRAGQRPFEPSFQTGQQYAKDLGRRFARGPALLLGGCILIARVAYSR